MKASEYSSTCVENLVINFMACCCVEMTTVPIPWKAENYLII